MKRHHHEQRGTVSLLVLSLVTVLAIALASYVTLSSRSMRLSNRAFLTGLSAQLAESGIEQALYAINASDWTSWTAPGGGALASTDTSAVRTITFASTKYGSSGVVGSINLRINGRKASSWDFSTTYTTADIVWYLGRWWQCVTAHGPVSITTTPGTTANWVSAPEDWSSSISYAVGDIALTGGTAYRCTAAHTNQQPPNASYWTSLGTPSAWSSTTSYAANAVVTYQGMVYRCHTANTGYVPTNAAYWAGAPTIYSEGVSTPPGTSPGSGPVKLQVRAEISPVPLFPNALGGSASVRLASTGNIDSYNPGAASTWSSATTYALNDFAVQSGIHYRSIANSNTNRTPPNATWWTTSPLNYSAVIASPSVTISAAANIWGHVAATTNSLATSTVVKSATSSASPNQDPSRLSTSYFVPVLDVQSVTGAGNLPSGNTYLSDGAVTLGTAGATSPAIYNVTATWDGGFLYSGLYLPDSSDTLTINGPVILNVTGDLYLSSGTITVASTGSLEIYFTGELYIGSSSGSGGGFINNTNVNNDSTKGPDPKRLILIGTSTYNSSSYHYMWTARSFYGLIYMPSAYIHNWNSGYSPARYGAQSASNIYFNHTINFHYDETLRTAGRLARFVDSPFYVTTWRQLTDSSEQVTF